MVISKSHLVQHPATLPSLSPPAPMASWGSSLQSIKEEKTEVLHGLWAVVWQKYLQGNPCHVLERKVTGKSMTRQSLEEVCG